MIDLLDSTNDSMSQPMTACRALVIGHWSLINLCYSHSSTSDKGQVTNDKPPRGTPLVARAGTILGRSNR